MILKRKCFDQAGNEEFLNRMWENGKGPGQANFNSKRWNAAADHIFGDGQPGAGTASEGYKEYMKRKAAEAKGAAKEKVKETLKDKAPKGKGLGKAGKVAATVAGVGAVGAGIYAYKKHKDKASKK